MSVSVKIPEGHYEYFEDENNVSYERAVGPGGELYIIGRDPRHAENEDPKGPPVLFGGRHIVAVFSPSGWHKALGPAARVDVTRLPAVDPNAL